MPENSTAAGRKTISSVTVAISIGIVVFISNVVFVPFVWNEISLTWEELDRELRDIESMRKSVKEVLSQIPAVITRHVRETVRRRIGDELITTSKRRNRTIIRRRRIHRRKKDGQRRAVHAHGAPNLIENDLPQLIVSAPKGQCSCSPQNSCLSGPPGPPGLKGEDGYSGQQGKPGIKGADATDVTMQTVFSGCLICPSGPDGPQGEDGQTGLPGLRGPTGNTGSPGRNGVAGPPGDSGPPGKTGKKGKTGGIGYPGADGVTSVGESGPKGLPGPPGPPGAPGDEGDSGGDESASGPEGSTGERGLPGREGEAAATGEQGSAGKPGKPRNECGCKELLLRKISIINPNVSHRRHLALHSLISQAQGRSAKHPPELELISNENKSEQQQVSDGSILGESSGEEGDYEADSITDSDKRTTFTLPKLIDEDDEKLLETESVRVQEQEKEIEKTPATVATTAPIVTMEDEATEKPNSMTASMEGVAAKLDDSINNNSKIDNSKKIAVSISETNITAVTRPEMEQIFDRTGVNLEAKPNGTSLQTATSKTTLERKQYPTPPSAPPRTQISEHTEIQYIGDSNPPSADMFISKSEGRTLHEEELKFTEAPHLFRAKVIGRESTSEKVSHGVLSQLRAQIASRYHHPKRKVLDVNLLSAARRKFREDTLGRGNSKKLKKELATQQNRGKKIPEIPTNDGLVEELHRTGELVKWGQQSVLPLAVVGVNTLNIQPGNAQRNPSSQRKTRTHVHAASHFRMIKKKELVQPPVEEFVRKGTDEGLYAVEKELEEAAQRGVETTAEETRADYNSSAAGRSSERKASPEASESHTWAGNTLEFVRPATFKSLLSQRSKRPNSHSKAKTFVASTAKLRKVAPIQQILTDGIEKQTVLPKRKQPQQVDLRSEYKEDGAFEFLNKQEENVSNSRGIEQTKITDKSGDEENGVRHKHRNAKLKKDKDQSSPINVIKIMDEEMKEQIPPRAPPLAPNSNMRIVAAGQNLYVVKGNRYLRILNGEVESPIIENSDRSRSGREKTVVRKGISVDRVAYSPLAESKAVISDKRYPLGVRLVNVRSSGLKRVPMSEMTEDQDSILNSVRSRKLTLDDRANLLRRSPMRLHHPVTNQGVLVDHITAGGRRGQNSGAEARAASTRLNLTPPVYLRGPNEANEVRNRRPSPDFWATQRLLR